MTHDTTTTADADLLTQEAGRWAGIAVARMVAGKSTHIRRSGDHGFTQFGINVEHESHWFHDMCGEIGRRLVDGHDWPGIEAWVLRHAYCEPDDVRQAVQLIREHVTEHRRIAYELIDAGKASVGPQLRGASQ